VIRRGRPRRAPVPLKATVARHQTRRDPLPSLFDPTFAEEVAGASSGASLRVPATDSLRTALAEVVRLVGADDKGDAELVEMTWRSGGWQLELALVGGVWTARPVGRKTKPRTAPARRTAQHVLWSYEIQVRDLRTALAAAHQVTRAQLEEAMSDDLRRVLSIDQDGYLKVQRLNGDARPVFTDVGPLHFTGLITEDLRQVLVGLVAAQLGVSPSTILKLRLRGLSSPRP
jgi:hypothetical protein